MIIVIHQHDGQAFPSCPHGHRDASGRGFMDAEIGLDGFSSQLAASEERENGEEAFHNVFYCGEAGLE
jgi:hypothetical protein